MWIKYKNMNDLKAKVVAFYLPQFHPVKENNEWWGNGFTEWTSVGKAQRYFKNHYQPRVPADLGYYDLRLPEVREAQAELAREAGVSAFCYWHYWFGNGKQLLEKPLQEVVRLKKPNFPFCLAWANHDWYNKQWNSKLNILQYKPLMAQLYPGKEDIDAHFHAMLPMFKDERYFRVNGKLFFMIYDIKSFPLFEYFVYRWNELALENDLPGFHFVANTSNINDVKLDLFKKVDAISLSRLYAIWDIDTSLSSHIFAAIRTKFSRLLNHSLNVREYEDAIKKMNIPEYEIDNIYPTIIPCWDNSPRRGPGAYILNNSTPDLFLKHVKQILERISKKKDEDKIIILKSWNEWAEGNYMEPDLRWRKGYIYALKNALLDK